MPKNWNRRFKHNRDKMKTGDILELAEVVRNLSLRDSEKGLSTGEKQMFVKAKKILASELMYAKDMDEEGGCRVARRRPRGQRERQQQRSQEDHRREARQGRVQERREARRPQDSRQAGCEGQAEDKGARLLEVSVWAVLAAAGSGDRLGADRPKAFARLGDEPLLAQSLKRLDDSDWVDFIVGCRSSRLGGACDPARRGARLQQGERVRDGRRDQGRVGRAGARGGARGCGGRARPRCGAAVGVGRGDRARADGSERRVGRSVARAALADTIKRVDDEGRVVETLNRDELRAVQTPQAFVASVVREAYAQGDVAAASDCSSLVEARGGRVRVVEGDPKLIKITDVGDLERVAALL